MKAVLQIPQQESDMDDSKDILTSKSKIHFDKSRLNALARITMKQRLSLQKK